MRIIGSGFAIAILCRISMVCLQKRGYNAAAILPHSRVILISNLGINRRYVHSGRKFLGEREGQNNARRLRRVLAMRPARFAFVEKGADTFFHVFRRKQFIAVNLFRALQGVCETAQR